MKKLKFIFIIVVIVAACSKDNIRPDQASSFMKFFGNAFLDAGSDVKYTSDKGFIVVGTLTNVDANSTRKKPLDKDIFLVKTNMYGNKLWDHHFGGELDDFGQSVQLTADGGYILCGTTVDTTSTGAETTNCLIVKVASDGTEQWSQSLGGAENQEGDFISVTGSGDYLIAGSTTAYRVPGGGFEGNPAGNKDIYILKISASGDSLWSTAFGYAGDDQASCIREKPDGGIVILGTTDHSEAGQDKNNLILITTNSSGLGPVNKTFGGEGEDMGNDFLILPDGYLVTGSYERNGISNAYLAKIPWNIFDPPVFEKFFGDATISSGNSVSLTQDDGFAICGSSGTLGSRNILFVKTDLSGELVAMATYGGTGDQWASALDITPDGGFIISGTNEYDGNALITLLKISGDGSF